MAHPPDPFTDPWSAETDPLEKEADIGYEKVMGNRSEIGRPKRGWHFHGLLAEKVIRSLGGKIKLMPGKYSPNFPEPFETPELPEPFIAIAFSAGKEVLQDLFP